MTAKNKQEALALLREELDTPVRLDRYKDSDLVLELVSALEGYWDDLLLQKYLTGEDPEWDLIRNLPLEDLYAEPAGVRPLVKKQFQARIVTLVHRWTRLGNKPIPLPDNEASRKLWAAVYPEVKPLLPVPFLSHPKKELDPTVVLGYEVAAKAGKKRLDNSGIIEMLTNMWMLCLLSHDEDVRIKALDDLETFASQFATNLDKCWVDMARVSAFLETRSEIKPDSRLAKLVGDLAKQNNKEVNLNGLDISNEEQLFQAIEEGTTPLHKDSGWKTVAEVKIIPIREVYDKFQQNLQHQSRSNFIEMAFVEGRPWMWSVAFGIGTFCAAQTANAKKRKVAQVVTVAGTILGLAGFVAAAVVSGGVSLILLPQLVGAFGLRSAVAVGVLGLLSVVSGVGFGNMLKSSNSLTNLYCEHLVDTALYYDKSCGLAKPAKGMWSVFSSKPPEERVEPQKDLIDIEKVFLTTLMANTSKLTEAEKKFYWFVECLGTYRAVHQYSVGVLGQPDVGKSEFLKAGCGFDTNPGFNKPTVRLMQYMDAERISWFDFPGLDDVFERNGTVLDFQVEADLANVLVVVWKAGNRHKSDSLREFLTKGKVPPLVVCYNMMDNFVQTVMQDYQDTSISAFNYVCNSIDEFDREMRATYNFESVKTIYTCFLKHPTVRDELLWNQLTYHYNILDASELNNVIKQAFVK